jgi:hypothetical protein
MTPSRCNLYKLTSSSFSARNERRRGIDEGKGKGSYFLIYYKSVIVDILCIHTCLADPCTEFYMYIYMLILIYILLYIGGSIPMRLLADDFTDIPFESIPHYRGCVQRLLSIEIITDKLKRHEYRSMALFAKVCWKGTFSIVNLAYNSETFSQTN